MPAEHRARPAPRAAVAEPSDAADFAFDRVLICGVGLIGSSVARALRRLHDEGRAGGAGVIVAADPDAAGLARARALGVVDETCVLATGDAAANAANAANAAFALAAGRADLIVLAAPVAQTQALLARIAPVLRADAVLTDVGSTKARICEAARALLGVRGARFVAAHPIAGGEASGVDAGAATLFAGRDVILCPAADTAPDAVSRVAAMWRLAGARIARMTPSQHDRLFASVSHLPHLLAFAFIEHILQSEEADACLAFAGPGFRDFTRIAASNPQMWRDICLANRDTLLADLDRYLAVLACARAMLADGDGAGLEALFARSRAARQDWHLNAPRIADTAGGAGTSGFGDTMESPAGQAIAGGATAIDNATGTGAGTGTAADDATAGTATDRATNTATDHATNGDANHDAAQPLHNRYETAGDPASPAGKSMTRREHMKQLELGPYARASGTLALPGSKSISNRVLLMAALAEGETRLENLLESDDTRVMLDALRLLGITWTHRPASGPAADDGTRESWRVTGSPSGFPVRDADIFVGNAGTAVRPLTAALALNEGRYHVSGVKRMHERPIGDLVEGLLAVGARIDYLGQPGFPPLRIHPGETAGAGVDRPIRVRGDVSSQFLSALLLALPRLSAHGRATVEVDGELISKPYVDITTGLMARFGVPVEREGWRRFSVAAGSRYRSPGTVVVEGDASSASYFLAAGALGGGPLRVEGVGRASIQGDVRFADALTRMGANVTMGEHWIEVRGVDTADARLRPVDMDCNLIPDAAMTIAVAALHASGPSTLRNIGSWRVKETDRISAMATELRKLGAEVREGPDWLRVVPPAQLRAGAVIDTYDDHRMAMCFSLVSLLGVPVTINDPDCVAKTFPDYFDRFAQVVR